MAKAERIIIDTNIVKSIGAAPSEHSKPLLDALDAFERGHLQLIKTSQLDEEWDRHMPANGLFLNWQADMISRGRIRRRELQTLPVLMSRLRTAVPPHNHEAVMKDAHIAAAAIETNARVLSLDDKIRGHLAAASPLIQELKKVNWANPSVPNEEVPAWLNRGAPHEEPRTLENWERTK